MPKRANTDTPRPTVMRHYTIYADQDARLKSVTARLVKQGRLRGTTRRPDLTRGGVSEFVRRCIEAGLRNPEGVL